MAQGIDPRSAKRLDKLELVEAHRSGHQDVGTTPAGASRPAFSGDVEAALRSIRVPVLYMPSETDMYFPLGDARYEAAFIPRVKLTPIPSLWGHTAGAGSNPADRQFINAAVAKFLGL